MDPRAVALSQRSTSESSMPTAPSRDPREVRSAMNGRHADAGESAWKHAAATAAQQSRAATYLPAAAPGPELLATRESHPAQSSKAAQHLSPPPTRDLASSTHRERVLAAALHQERARAQAASIEAEQLREALLTKLRQLHEQTARAAGQPVPSDASRRLSGALPKPDAPSGPPPVTLDVLRDEVARLRERVEAQGTAATRGPSAPRHPTSSASAHGLEVEDVLRRRLRAAEEEVEEERRRRRRVEEDLDDARRSLRRAREEGGAGMLAGGGGGSGGQAGDSGLRAVLEEESSRRRRAEQELLEAQRSLQDAESRARRGSEAERGREDASKEQLEETRKRLQEEQGRCEGLRADLKAARAEIEALSAAAPPSSSSSSESDAAATVPRDEHESVVAELTARAQEAEDRAAKLQETVEKLQAMRSELDTPADEDSMPGQLQRSQKEAIEAKTQVIVLQGELAHTQETLKAALKRAKAKAKAKGKRKGKA